MVLEMGDLIDWNYGYFEVGSINENQLVGGQFDQNYSVIASAFLVRKSSIQIERVRSI
jgi:ribosomal protein L20A (L18A)